MERQTKRQTEGETERDERERERERESGGSSYLPPNEAISKLDQRPSSVDGLWLIVRNVDRSS